LKLKILLLDIEAAPHTAFVWGTWDQNVGIDQLMEHGRTLCWAAKWLDQKKIYYMDERKGTARMVKGIHKMLSEADVVITYNGLKFDIPMLNNEFIKLGLDPIPPQKHIDLLRTARAMFKLASNKLQFVARYLKLGGKVANKGFLLWVGCLAGNYKDWQDMRRYNIGDVVLLEKVYQRLRPWVKNHPDVDVENVKAHCTHCGSENVQHRGHRYTKVFAIERLHCQSCGSWPDGLKTSRKKKK
jgi:DNA polymerase elongation subunit (family B)